MKFCDKKCFAIKSELEILIMMKCFLLMTLQVIYLCMGSGQKEGGGVNEFLGIILSLAGDFCMEFLKDSLLMKIMKKSASAFFASRTVTILNSF